MPTNFVTAVNDIMVQDGILAGDDDAITDFDSQQHVASIRKAKLAVQNELADLMVDEFFPYEKATSVITTSVGVRTYATPTGFLRQDDEHPWMIETNAANVSTGAVIKEYPGGEDKLRRHDLKYRENQGKPYFFYFEGGSTKDFAFYPVPNDTYYYRLDYEKELTVTDESDTLPFLSETEVRLFIQLCTRHFKYLRMSPTAREGIFPGGIELDAHRASLRIKLIKANRHKQPSKHYGRSFLSGSTPHPTRIIRRVT